MLTFEKAERSPFGKKNKKVRDMFCAKCGKELTENDRFCPKCGTKNLNYHNKMETFDRESQRIKEGAARVAQGLKSAAGLAQKFPAKKGRAWAALAVVMVVVLAVIGKSLWAVLGTGSAVPEPKGINVVWDGKGNLNFLNGTEVTLYEDADSGMATPDCTKYLVLDTEHNLYMYNKGKTDGILISDKAVSISEVSNEGCFYYESVEDHIFKDHLSYYDFASQESVETGHKDEEVQYSAGSKSVAGINGDGELVVFSADNKQSKIFCTLDSDAEICGVADDGSNVVWSQRENNASYIYSIKNEVPERIGKISSPNTYCRGYFLDHGKSILVYAPGGEQLILCDQGTTKEIELPGALDGFIFYIFNSKGQPVDSESDTTNEIYFMVVRDYGDETGNLYKMDKQGNLSREADDILQTGWEKICNQNFYYVNEDMDLMWTKLGEEKTVTVTTDVDFMAISPRGKYAYVEKAGSLYYWDTSDETGALHHITSDFDEDSDIYLTNDDKTIFYKTDTEKLAGFGGRKGTLYQYKVGSDPQYITDQAVGMLAAPGTFAAYVDIKKPYVEKFVRDDESEVSGIQTEYGIVQDGSYKLLVSA